MHTSSHQQPPPPRVNPSWLCYPVLMSVRSPLLSGGALFLTASQTHAVTQPRSPRRLPAAPLGPSASCLPSTVPQFPSAACDRLTCSEAEAARTRLPGTLPSDQQHGRLLPATSAHLVATVESLALTHQTSSAVCLQISLQDLKQTQLTVPGCSCLLTPRRTITPMDRGAKQPKQIKAVPGVEEAASDSAQGQRGDAKKVDVLQDRSCDSGRIEHLGGRYHERAAQGGRETPRLQM